MGLKEEYPGVAVAMRVAKSVLSSIFVVYLFLFFWAIMQRSAFEGRQMIVIHATGFGVKPCL